MRREEKISKKGKKYFNYYFDDIKYYYLGQNLGSCVDDPFIECDQIKVGGGMFGDEYIIVDNCMEAWKLLLDSISQTNPQTLEEKCECVQKVVDRFFGDFSHTSEREDFYNDSGVKLSSFAHQNIAACAERAILSHILLHFIGIESTFRQTYFTNNDGKPDHHSYNLVRGNGKYYLYDSTQPTWKSGVISPLIAEIPENVYEGMKETHDTQKMIGIHIKHYNPLTDKDYDVVYNPCNQIYEVSDQTIITPTDGKGTK